MTTCVLQDDMKFKTFLIKNAAAVDKEKVFGLTFVIEGSIFEKFDRAVQENKLVAFLLKILKSICGKTKADSLRRKPWMREYFTVNFGFEF